MNFTIFQFPEFLNEALVGKKFTEATPVQEKIIPMIQKNKSVVAQSQTGSGKTHAFLLPLFEKIDPKKEHVQVVITAPSRELAQQIYKEASFLTKYSPEEIRVSNFVGGTDKKRQIEKLNHAQPHLVIGTPGRILDLIKEQALDIHEAFALVVDEADMTLDFGFLKEVDAIAAFFAKNSQFLVFSATIPEKLRPFLKKYLENPEIVEISPENKIAPEIENFLLSTKSAKKDTLIYDLLTMGEPYLAFVFANTKQRVDELTEFLQGKNLKVAKIHGDLPPRERRRVMKQIQNLDYQYVVATDLAARGIDIEGISLVINDDIPQDLDYFIHRIGRTGRNNLKGTAITLYSPGEEDLIAQLENNGITFIPKTFKNGQLEDSFDRNRRKKRQDTARRELDPTLKGLVKKKKKKIKPGYKKEIKAAIKKNQQQQTKVAKRQELRSKRKKKKSTSEY